MSDNLIKRLINREEQAFRELIDTHKERVINICFRYIQNRADLEDLSQEVFIEVYRSIDRFRENAQLSTWIYRIAVNKSLDFIKKKKRKKRFAFMVSLSSVDLKTEPEQLVLQKTPADQMEQKERALLLNDAVNTLPDSQRTALILSQYEGLSRNEISEVMGISISAVDAALQRGKKNLHKKLYRFFSQQ